MPLIDDTQRVLSLASVLHLDYAFFVSVDRRAADLQDLLFNETWFIVEGFVGTPRVDEPCPRRQPAGGGAALQSP